MFGRDNAVSRGAMVTRGWGSGTRIFVAWITVVLGTTAAPRVHIRAGARAAQAAFGTLLGVATPITDETVSVPMASCRGIPIRLPFPGDLRLEVNVARGARVNVHVISEADWGVFQKAEGRLLNGRFRFDFLELQALATAQARLSERVWEGRYFIVVENPTV